MSVRRASPLVLLVTVASVILALCGSAQAAVRRPSAPRSVTAAAGNASATVRWKAPSSTGGSAITAYVVKRATASKGPWTTAATVGATKRSATLTRLTNGRAYYLRVFAKNRVGLGAGSTTVKVVPHKPAPPAKPGAPTGVSALTSVGDGAVTIGWHAAPANGTTILGYTVQQSTDSLTWTTAGSPSASDTELYLPNLAVGTPYSFRVRAESTAGPGPWSTVVTATPLAEPGAPTDLTATPGDHTVTLSWNAPADTGGAASVHYQVERWDGSGWGVPAGGVTSETRFTDTGLDNGTSYTWKVATVNSHGLSDYVSVSATPSTVPTQPVITRLVLAGSVELWIAPTPDGGSRLTTITIQWHPASGWDGTTWTDLGTDPSTGDLDFPWSVGDVATVRIIAVNANGPSEPSAPVTLTVGATPAGTANGTAAPGSAPGAVHVSWQQLATSTSSPAPAYYQVQYRPTDCFDDSCYTTVRVNAPTVDAYLNLTTGRTYDFAIFSCEDEDIYSGGVIQTAPVCNDLDVATPLVTAP